MKSINLKIALSGLVLTLACGYVAAQQKEAQKVSKAVEACIQDAKSARETLGEDFNMYQWAKDFQKNCEKVLDEQDSEVLFEIADQEEIVQVLARLSKSCEALEEYQKELEKLEKIYREKVKDKTSEKTTDKLDYREQRVVSFTTSDARRMKINLNSIVNMMEGDKSIFKIFR